MAVSRSLGQLTIDLVAKVGGWTAGLDKAERELKTRTSRMERQMKAFRNTLTTAFAAIGVGAIVREIVRNTAEAETAFANLRNAVENNGGAVGRSTERLAEMAGELQKVTTFGDDTIMTAQGLLLRFQSIQGLNFDRALQSTLDLATALGKDLPATALLVGKALESPVKGLTQLERSGVVLGESQRELIKRLVETGQQAEAQRVLLDGLEQRYQGAAAAARDTFGGALLGVKNAVGDLLEAKGGLPEAVSELNKFAGFLQDPQTVEAANTLTSAVVRFSAAAISATGAVANFAKGMGEFFARVVSGPDFDDQVKGLKKELEEVQGVILRGEQDLAKIDPGSRWARSLATNIERQRQKAEELQKQIAAMTFATPGGGSPQAGSAPTGPAAPPPPTEEFLKLEASLNQQIALYGSVGEAAKLAYQIQSGQLDELSDKEQQRILALARQYDSVVEASKATQEREQAEARLIQTFDQQVATYERQIALTGEITELEKVRYEIANGGLAGLNEAQRERLELLAEEVERIQQIAKEQAEREAILNEGKALMESLRTPLEQYEASIERFNELRAKRAITEETYVRAVIDAQDKLKEATEETNEFMEGLAGNTKGLLSNALFGGMEGKIGSIGKAFARMVKQMLADALAANLTKALFGEGGGFGGIVGSLFGGGRELGGPVAAGTMYEINERGDPEMLNVGGRQYLMMGKQSGQVTPLNGGAASVQVSIENYGTSKGFEVQRVSDEQIRIIARDEVSRGAPSVIASALENPNSRVSKAVSRNTTAGRQRS